ncbi:putative clathrin assembly protein [Senna tora]|uniref:Putative clathrin assembly protein n=1 Tax=Senna tora TaxID=362788 RepID=A0A835CIM0_9FABA|nr:putative clathrin assembly protein [Senna tora]
MILNIPFFFPEDSRLKQSKQRKTTARDGSKQDQESPWSSEGPNEHKPREGRKQHFPRRSGGSDREGDEARRASGGGEAHPRDPEPDVLLARVHQRVRGDALAASEQDAELDGCDEDADPDTEAAGGGGSGVRAGDLLLDEERDADPEHIGLPRQLEVELVGLLVVREDVRAVPGREAGVQDAEPEGEEERLEQIFSRMQHLQLLLERFLACRPTGVAKHHRIVIVSLYPIVKESFQIYYDVTELLSILLDRFTDMEVPECLKVYDTFCRVGKQYDELELFYCWCKSIGIARSSEYPEIERITPKKLEIMDEFIKEKSAEIQSRRERSQEDNEERYEVEEPEEVDVNAVKALPPPEEVIKEEQPEEEVKEEVSTKVEEKEADLLNLGEDTLSSEEQGEKFALALFDDGAAAAPAGARAATQALPWRAFDDEADWETALVQSATNLPNQKPALGGGFDTLLLDGMYKQAETNAAMQGPGYGLSGSASSVALGSAGRPAMLALPAPPSSGNNGPAPFVDPFAASLAVAPPSYVQMSEIEKKQRLLMEEQILWQQYGREGMQGQAALARIQQNNGYMGGYAQPKQGTNYR